MAKQLTKILIADDSKTMRAVLGKKLEDLGYQVALASDGLDALNKFYADPPEAVLLDVLMPVLNGYHVCRFIKNDPFGKSVPVIMLTAEDQPRDKFWGHQTGADLYVIKNGQWDELEKGLLNLLSAYKEHRPKTKQTPSLNTGNKDSGVQILTRLNALLDKQLFQATFRNEVAKIFRVMRDYEQTFEDVFSLLCQVIGFDVASVLVMSPNQQAFLGMYSSIPVSTASFEKCKAHILKFAASGQTKLSVKELEEKNYGLSPDDAGPDIDLSNQKYFPLKAGGQVIGLIGLANRKENSFTDEELANIETVVDDFAILIDNSRLHNSIKMLSIVDGLTNVFNHRHFQDLLLNELHRALRYKLHLSLVILDIDHFKKFNDTYGHQQGDVILKGVAQIMKDHVRNTDFVARYGGEEFAIIMPETDLKGALILCDRIRGFLEKHPFPSLQGDLHVTASFGVSELLEDDPVSLTSAELIRRSDIALYTAKEAGRNRVASYDGHTDAKMPGSEGP